MNEYDVKRLALVLAIQAEIEGMIRRNDEYGYFYKDEDFQSKAEELRVIAYKHNEQL